MRRFGLGLLWVGLLCLGTAGCDGTGSAAQDTGGVGADVVATDSAGEADTPAAPQDTVVAPDGDPGGEVAEDIAVAPDVPAPPDGGDAPDTVDAGSETTEPGFVETRLDTICVGERCAASPDHAPNPGEFGPFPVGVKTIEIWDPDPPFDREPRLIRTEIWYPTTDEYADGPYWTYDLATDAPEELQAVFEAVQIDGLPSHGVRDAPIRAEDGPYPMIFFSHGAYGVRFQGVYLTDVLASHGYVVVAPDHKDNTTWDYLLDGYDAVEVMLSGGQRVGDGEFLIDTMFELAADPESEWNGVIATKRVGFTGHSFGGFLSLVMGARDDRLSVVVPMAPAANMASASGINLGIFPLPFLMMGSDMDRTLDFEPYMWNPYQSMPKPKAFLRFFRGGHYTFTDMCSVDVIALAEELGWGDAEDALSDGCGEENFDPATARSIITHYVVAMFNAYLRLSPESRDYINDDRIAEQVGEVELYLNWGDDPLPTP